MGIGCRSQAEGTTKGRKVLDISDGAGSCGDLNLSDGVGQRAWGCDAMLLLLSLSASSFSSLLRDWQTRLASGSF